MSTRRGQSSRQRPQKYQNTHSFKNDLYDKTAQTKKLNSIDISGVCERCKSILEWKIKYKKFKFLKAPKTCTKCSQKTVKHAYHIMCKPCSQKADVCPKCGKKEELVPEKPTAEEQIQLDENMTKLLKSLPERKRRTFLRYMEKNAPGAKKNKKQSESDEKKTEDSTTNSSDIQDDSSEKTEERVYLTKDDIMAKLQALKLSSRNCDDDDDLDDLDSEEFTSSEEEIDDSDDLDSAD